jgi:NADH:ubiquinone oxidoreductase subunit 4 (subunit M)
MMICSDIRILFILKWALFVLSVVLTLVLVVIAFKKRNEKVCGELFIFKICLPYPLVIGIVVAGIICLIIFFIFFEVVD